jgi:FkbM family methyltransferase
MRLPKFAPLLVIAGFVLVFYIRNGRSLHTRQSIHTLLDFVEIGTSNFDTIIQTANQTSRGISVDAMKPYLEDLPDLPFVHKVNAAISGFDTKDDFAQVFFVSKKDILKYDLPSWVKGCNRVGHEHPIVAKLLEERNLQHILQRTQVPIVSINALFLQEGICRVKLLKIDVEGMDSELLIGYSLFLWNNPGCYADNIVFEINSLSDRVELQRASHALELVGYTDTGTANGTDNVGRRYNQVLDGRQWMQFVAGEHFSSKRDAEVFGRWYMQSR